MSTTLTPARSRPAFRASAPTPTMGATMPDSLDFTKGTYLPCLTVESDPDTGRGEVVATMPVLQLLELVLDPKASEDPKMQALDPRLAQTAEIRKEVQRAVEGAKARNAVSFGNYLVEGGRGLRPTMIPAITLYHPEPLEVIDLGGGLHACIIPFGDFLVCLDGETQRLAWGKAITTDPTLAAKRVKVTIHFGKTPTEARQGFYDLNTREVKPNAAVSISMDTLDPATNFTRRLIDASDLLQAHGVNLVRRQLRRSDKEIVTISALRTAIVTTMLGAAGLAVGSRSVSEKVAELSDAELEEVAEAVVDVWVPLVEELEDAFTHRVDTVVTAPAVLAGLGILAHHAMPDCIRNRAVARWTVDEVLEALDGVVWSRAVEEVATGNIYSPWEGVAGKVTPGGALSIGGPKEVGHAVAEALENPQSTGGKAIRLQD